MISSFDIKNLNEFLKDFYHSVGIRISVFDDEFNMVTEYPENAPEICKLIRSTISGEEGCKKCDLDACKKAKLTKTQHVYLCHAGITEAVTPITYSGVILGYVILAHMMPIENYNEAIDNAINLISKYDVDIDFAKTLLKEISPKSKEQIYASVKLCNAVASYIYVSDLVKFKNENIATKIHDYVCKNLAFDLSSDAICRNFLISRTKLYEISNKSFGMSISEFVTKKRIEKAKELIKNGLSVNKVAELVGFQEPNYFTKVFKKYTNYTPSQYKNV